MHLAEAPPPVSRRVALKVLHGGRFDPGDLERFRLEVSSQSALAHPNIAAIYDTGVWAGRPYYTMEWVPDGVSITEHCRRRELSLRGRLELFLQACGAIQHAHDRGFVHCDIKPANILVAATEPSVVKVIDFGLAKAWGAATDVVPGRRQPSGSLAYLAPEQVLSPDIVDVRTDVHALGLVLFEVLTGQRARPEAAMAEFDLPGQILLVAAGVADTPSRRGGDARAGIRSRNLRGPLDWIVAKALAADRTQRYGAVAELQADVQRCIAGEDVEAGPAAWTYRTRGWLRRHCAALVATSLVVASLVVGTAWTASAWSAAAQAARSADDSRRAAVEAAGRFHLLADGARLRQARVLVAELWPIGPELVPAIDRWMAEFGEPLVRRLPFYRATRDDLARGGVTAAEGVGGEPTRSEHHPVGHRIRRVESWQSALADPAPAMREALAALGADAARNHAEGLVKLAASMAPHVDASAPTTPLFLAARDQSLWGTVTDLIAGVEAMAAPDGLIARVRQRRADAIAVGFGSLGAPSTLAAWAAAGARVAADPRFAGSVLAPITGLLPLGRDPESGLEEFAHLASGVPATRGGDGRLELPAGFGIVLVLLPPSRVWLGAQADAAGLRNFDPRALPDEGPVRLADIPAMLVAKFELTVAQARRCGFGEVAGDVDDHEFLTLSPARARQLADAAGLDIVSEDVWEHACRAGSATPWWCGDEVASLSARAGGPAAANLASQEFGRTLWNGSLDAPAHRDGHLRIAPPDALRANPFGLHHVHGNQFEICRAPDGGAVLRGGSYFSGPAESRATTRLRIPPGSKMLGPTVRLARTLPP